MSRTDWSTLGYLHTSLATYQAVWPTVDRFLRLASDVADCRDSVELAWLRNQLIDRWADAFALELVFRDDAPPTSMTPTDIASVAWSITRVAALVNRLLRPILGVGLVRDQASGAELDLPWLAAVRDTYPTLFANVLRILHAGELIGDGVNEWDDAEYLAPEAAKIVTLLPRCPGEAAVLTVLTRTFHDSFGNRTGPGGNYGRTAQALDELNRYGATSCPESEL